MDSLPGFSQLQQSLRGGYQGRSTHHPGYSFRGRGQVLGAGPGDAPPAPSGLFGGPRGRGGGFVSFMNGLGRGGLPPLPPNPYASFHGLTYGTGRRLGDGDNTTDGGGRGGGPGRGGSGSSKT